MSEIKITVKSGSSVIKYEQESDVSPYIAATSDGKSRESLMQTIKEMCVAIKEMNSE